MKLFSFKDKIKVLLNTPDLKTIFGDVTAKLKAANVIEKDSQTHPWGNILLKLENIVKPYLSNVKLPKL